MPSSERKKQRGWLLWGALIVALVACRPREAEVVLPTVVDLDTAATQAVLTREAPPPGFASVSFPRIDANLGDIPGWRSEFSLAFNGNFSRTSRSATALTEGVQRYNLLQNARRLTISFVNTLQTDADPVALEIVTLGEDPFLVRNGVCIRAEDEARLAAQLSAGAVLGGLQQAAAAPQRAIINGQQAWRYSFTHEDLVLPGVTFGDDSRVTGLAGELWVAPALNAVVRYYLNLDVENVGLFESSLPVTGTLLLRYDLYREETPPNISVPFGC
jgi:hypothetical protein